MAGYKEFKKALKNDQNFKIKFLGVKNEQEAINIAKQLGYDLDIKDTKQDEELTDNFLEAVAGGKGGTQKENNTFYHVEASNYDLVIDKNTGKILDSKKKNNYKG